MLHLLIVLFGPIITELEHKSHFRKVQKYAKKLQNMHENHEKEDILRMKMKKWIEKEIINAESELFDLERNVPAWRGKRETIEVQLGNRS